MKKLAIFSLSLILVCGLSNTSLAGSHAGKKVLYIDSYHEGYGWSDGITMGVKKALEGSSAELKIIRMDTKRNTGEAFKKEAALKAKSVIEQFKPDVVIASDDNASKYLIEPYFKDAELPFVFCGVNWDAGVYGYPYKNVTGMVEVTPVAQLIEQLRNYAEGDRIGWLGPDILTARKEAANYKTVFGLSLKEYYAADVEDYKKGFVELQKEVDILLLASDGGLYKDVADELRAFVEANTRKPTGASYDFMAGMALVTFAKVAEEQGAWAGQTAGKILDGASPAGIPIVKNKDGKLIVNARIAKTMGADIPFEVIEAADKVIE